MTPLIPYYMINDEHGQQVARLLPSEYADEQAGLDAWLKTFYWECRQLTTTSILASLPVPSERLRTFSFIPPTVELLVAQSWLFDQLTEPEMPVEASTAELLQLEERFAVTFSGLPPWHCAAWVLSEVRSGHLIELLAPHPGDAAIHFGSDDSGQVVASLHFGTRIFRIETGAEALR